MYPVICRNIYFAVQLFRGERVHECLETLQRTQWLSHEELKSLQWTKLYRMLEHAYTHSAYYRQAFDKAGVRPGDVKCQEDLHKLPLLTREQVIKETKSILTRGRGRMTIYHSSGTTGTPLTLYLCREALGWHHSAQWRGFSWYGIQPGHKHATLWGYPLLPHRRAYEGIKDFFLNRLHLSAFRLSEAELSRFYEQCCKKKPLYLYGYASALTRFAAYAKAVGKREMAWRPVALISTSEILYPWQREVIHEAFQCPVVNEYGASEAGIIAFQCPQGGMHITSENVYVEILRLDSPETAPPGELGRVVVTELRNTSFPLIRYDLGDCAALSTEHCPCGRGLPLIKSIEGRFNDVLIGPNGGMVHSELLAYINRVLHVRGHGINEFVVVQKSRARLVLLVDLNTDVSTEAENYLKRQLQKYLGEEVKLTVEKVSELPRNASGKMRYFISEAS